MKLPRMDDAITTPGPATLAATAAIDSDHPAVRDVLDEAGTLLPQIKAMLRVIEETVPVQRIWIDTAENKDTPRTGFDGEPNQAVIEVATVLFDDLVVRKGMTHDEARKAMLKTEPFQKYPSLIANLGGSQ